MLIGSLLKCLLLTLLLTGCSSTSLIYNNADWLIPSKIDDYFSLSGPQRQQLKADMDGILKWHRQQELAEYSDLINQFTEQYANELTREELDLFYDKVSSARIRLVEASIPAASLFLSTVSIKQIDYYDRAFLKRRAKQATKLDTSPEEYSTENFTSFVENLEEWFGSFDENQIAQLRTISDARPDNRHYWFEQSKLRHQEFSDLLRSRPSEKEIARYLHDRFVALKRADTEEHDIGHQVRLYWMSALLNVDKIIVTKQRNHFISRISDYSLDFLTLSKQSSKPLITSNER
ncbi:MAG: hypothetical protein ACI9AP_000521 [Flavobacteriales bacterium]|jgi:hypothetical protein